MAMSAEDFLFIVNNAIFLENFMKHFRSLAMLMLTITLTSTVCFYDEDRNKGGGCGWGLPDLTGVTNYFRLSDFRCNRACTWRYCCNKNYRN